MGAVPRTDGVTFRVWAPHATAVAVAGSFNDWSADGVAMTADPAGSGTWSVFIAGATVGAEYRYLLDTPAGIVWRIDPYARQVTGSAGNAVVYDPAAFDWGDQQFDTPAWNEVVLYEMHVGTFAARADVPGTFDRAIRRMPYLRDLGIGAIQVMPPFEYAGDVSWGYNPAHVFAIEFDVRRPGRVQAFRQIGSRARDRGDRRRGVQPPRSG